MSVEPSYLNVKDNSDEIQNNQNKKNRTTLNLRGSLTNKTGNKSFDKIQENFNLQTGLISGIGCGILILSIILFISYFKNKRKRKKVSIILNPKDLKILERPKDLLLEYLPFKNN